MQSAQFLSSWFPWKSMDPLTFNNSYLIFALIIFQLYGQKWEEAVSEIENHLPLYQPFSICLLTDISRKDLPLLFNHSSSLSLVIIKISRFNVLSFSEAVSHFDSFACFLSTGCPKMKMPHWILIVVKNLVSHQILLALFLDTMFILAYPLSPSRLNGVQRRTEWKRKRH